MKKISTNYYHENRITPKKELLRSVACKIFKVSNYQQIELFIIVFNSLLITKSLTGI